MSAGSLPQQMKKVTDMSTTPLSDREQLLVNQLGLTKEVNSVEALNGYFSLGDTSSATQRISVLVEYKNLLKDAEAAGLDVLDAANKARAEVVAEFTRIQEAATVHVTKVVTAVVNTVESEFQKLRAEIQAKLAELTATAVAPAAISAPTNTVAVSTTSIPAVSAALAGSAADGQVVAIPTAVVAVPEAAPAVVADTAPVAVQAQ